MKSFLHSAAPIILAVLPFALSAQAETLQQRITSVLEKPDYEAVSFVGISILDTTTGEELFSQYTNKLFTPASNAKLFSSAAALDVFGPDHTFQTTVHHDGTLEDGTLTGSLILHGGGDPTLFTDSLKALAAQVSEKVNVIHGNLIVDVSLFNSPLKGPGWMWDDNPDTYSMSISPLMLNYNTTRITVSQTQNGQLSARLFPETQYPVVEFLGGFGPVRINRKPFHPTFTVTGSELPESGRAETTLAVYDPAPWIGHAFYSMLLEQGIEFTQAGDSGSTGTQPSTQPIVVAKVPQQGTQLCSVQSKPMSEILTLFNKPSENAIGEVLLHHLAGPTGAKPANWRNGSAALATWLEETVGLQKESFRLQDGSGLTRYNLITPAGTTQLLQHMAKGPNAKTYLESLPIAGVDGTLRNRMKTLPQGAAIHAKTGTMSGVSCLSGYAKTPEGKWRTFSILVNGYTGSSNIARLLQDELCVQLVALPTETFSTLKQ